MPRWHRAPSLLIVAVVLAAGTACGPAGRGAAVELSDLTGTTVEVVAVWQRTEQVRFERVLDAFARRTGATVRYTSTAGDDIAAVLDARLAAGDAPDVAILPQPGLLRRYAGEGAILPVDDVVGADALARYADVWRRLGTVNGRVYGVWFKAANKSLVWYNVGAFERAGVVPPSEFDGFLEVMGTLREAGIAPLAVAGADGWTLTDWFENVYLRVAGPQRYDALAERRLPWTDPTVVRALGLLASVFAEAGGSARLGTSFEESVDAVFSLAPAAAMVFEGDFVPGVASLAETLDLGVDVDVFPFPDVAGSGRLVVGGGDVAVLMRRTEGGRALVRWLATAEAAEVWARLGGFVSPNEELDLAVYPDATSRTIARTLLEAGDSFRFDLSDLQPVEFGGTTDAGLFAILADFLRDAGSPAVTAQRLETSARRAFTGR